MKFSPAWAVRDRRTLRRCSPPQHGCTCGVMGVPSQGCCHPQSSVRYHQAADVPLPGRGERSRSSSTPGLRSRHSVLAGATQRARERDAPGAGERHAGKGSGGGNQPCGESVAVGGIYDEEAAGVPVGRVRVHSQRRGQPDVSAADFIECQHGRRFAVPQSVEIEPTGQRGDDSADGAGAVFDQHPRAGPQWLLG